MKDLQIKPLNSKTYGSRKLKNPAKTAWDLMSKFVRLKNADWRGNVKCFTCSAIKNWKEMQAGHYIHRDSLNFDEIGVQPQCEQCNKWKHGNSGRFAYEIIHHYGTEELERLESLRHKERKFSTKELYEKIAYLKAKIKELL